MADGVLAPFVLENVESGEKKSSGAYGAVYKVTVNGVTCIDKRLHDILVNPEVPRRQRESVRKNFLAECVILSKLRHPHIVHFVGVRCGPNPCDLSLVMECLHTDLAKFLEDHQEKGVDIPLPIKLSILLDVSYGLLYLHTLTPPIIHRDLSANNILLTADGLQAKIADLGVSKLLDLQTQTKIAQTKVPGSQNYMPPEALTENPQYGLKLDIFSFGHLMLYTATQEFPAVHEVTLTPAILQQGTIQIMKRRKAIDQMGGEQHCLHPLVIQCLQDEPEQRPTTLKLNESLKEHCTKHPRRVAEVLQFFGETEKVTKETDAVWRSMVATLEEENRKLSMDVGALHRDKKSLEKSMDAIDARNEELELIAQKLQEEMIQKEEWTRKQLESMTEDNRKVNQKCQNLQAENMQFSEQMKKLSVFHDGSVALVNMLKAQARKLEQEKQNEVQIAKTEAESERHDREEAHRKIAYLATQHAEETGRLKEERLQLQEQHKIVLAELGDRNREVKQYKEQVEQLKDQLAKLECHNKELSKERDKLLTEYDKTRKKLVNAQTKADRKAKKDAAKLSDMGVTSPEPTGMYKVESEHHDQEEVQKKIACLATQHAEETGRLNAEQLQLQKQVQKMESSQSPLTSPVVDLPRASNPGQHPPRILEEDEVIEQEKIKQALDLQSRKRWQPFQSMDEHTTTASVGTLSGQAILKANSLPVQYTHKQSPPAEYFHEHPPAGGFAARSGADIEPAPFQITHQQLPPCPLKSSPTPPTMFPNGIEVRQLPPPHAGGPQGKPPYSQQIQPRDSSHLGAPGIPPEHRTYPQTLPAHHWSQPHPEYPTQYGGTEMPHQKLIPNQRSVGGGLEHQTLLPLGRKGNQMQDSGKPHSSYQQHLRSLLEDQYPTGPGEHPLSAPLPRVDRIDPGIPRQLETHELYEEGSPHDQNLDSIIHVQAESVTTEVGNESSRQLTMHHIPYDPNLTCPMCDKRFKVGEVKKYRTHVKKQCTGTQEVISDI